MSPPKLEMANVSSLSILLEVREQNTTEQKQQTVWGVPIRPRGGGAGTFTTLQRHIMK